MVCSVPALVGAVARAAGQSRRRRRGHFSDASDGGAPAVDVQDRALDVARRVGGEEGDDGGDFRLWGARSLPGL
jgi:hypothetical protein